MSKAIQGAAMLAGSAALLATGVGAFGVAAATWFNSGMFATHLMEGLALAGISTEAGAIADALSQNRGMNITSRQPASFRQVIVGEQRVGGVTIYRSTTGSTHRQYNFVIVLAGHECDSILNLYLDGRRVFWDEGSVGHTVRNGVHFGGEAAGGDHTGPNGQTYNFGGLVYCEAKYGDQAEGDVIGGLTANDPTWAASADGSPWVGGCTYVYLKVRYDEGQFTGEPEIRFSVRGKNNILDPRTGLRGYTNNWALLVADQIADTEFGLGCDEEEVYEGGAGEQLIAAANVCDELVPLAVGGSEPRYLFNWHWDTSTSPGDVLQNMMSAAAGRISRIGGEWYIWPAYWQGPSAQFDKSALTGGFSWNPERPLRDRYNRVTGTYTAPNYPYNTGGNLYDSYGWYDGSTPNTFPFAFQTTSYPMYAADARHGYAVDQFLIEDTVNEGVYDSGTTYAKGDVVMVDGAFFRAKVNAPSGAPSDSNPDWLAYAGNLLPKEISNPGVLSIAQAQRVAKIYLLRNRHQGNGMLPMNLAAYGMQAADVMEFTLPEMGWTSKLLEIAGSRLKQDEQNGAIAITTEFDVQETSGTIYEWDPSEELTVYDVPAATFGTPAAIDPPTDMSLTSGAATAVTQPDGSVLPRVKVEWTAPQDARVRYVQVRHQLSTDTAWTDDGLVDVANLQALIAGVIAGETYNFAIRSAAADGRKSAWVEIDGYTVSLTVSSLLQLAIAQSALAGQAYSDGTAGITVAPFTDKVGGHTRSCLSSSYLISGLLQARLYFVYFVDPTYAGGAITPIATLDPSDYLGKAGYFLIGSLRTPAYSVPGAVLFRPTAYLDSGTQTSADGDHAYDTDPTTCAFVGGWASRYPPPDDVNDFDTVCDVLFSGFPVGTLAASATLTVRAAYLDIGPDISADVEWFIAGSSQGSASISAGSATDYTFTVPSGTAVDEVTVRVYVTIGTVPYDPLGINTNFYRNFAIYDIKIS